MPMFRANTTISILSSATSVDEWGDDVDNDNVTASGIHASITEVSTTAQSESSTRPQVIRTGICRVTSVYQSLILQNCRIRDEKTGYTWIIMDIYRGNNVLGNTPLRIDLMRSS